ncbi:MAG: hypothetical protein ICV79_27920 [Flavisolibacter sp.]|nr:hypothetical protein [Flavisolibacter sp.]
MAKEKKESTSDKKRNTYFFHPDTTRKVKYIAFMEEKTQTEIIEQALNEYISKWEKKNGEVPMKQ